MREMVNPTLGAPETWTRRPPDRSQSSWRCCPLRAIHIVPFSRKSTIVHKGHVFAHDHYSLTLIYSRRGKDHFLRDF